MNAPKTRAMRSICVTYRSLMIQESDGRDRVSSTGAGRISGTLVGRGGGVDGCLWQE